MINKKLKQDPVLQILEGLDGAIASLCKKDFYEFVQEFWDEAVSEPFIGNWHIEYICRDLENVAQNLINNKPKLDRIYAMPPGSTKSTICSIMFPVWLWTLKPSLKIITISYSETLAVKNSGKSKDLLDCEKFKRLYPYVKLRADYSAKRSYENTEGGSRMIATVRGTLTGLHANLLIADDISSVSQANSRSERELINEWVSETLPSRKTNQSTSPTIYVSQRLHSNDVAGFLLNRGGKYKQIIIPAELNDSANPKDIHRFYKDGLYDPVRYSREVLDNIRIDLGSRAYSTQFLQNPESNNDSIIKEEWINIISKDEFEKIIQDRRPTVHYFADTAFSDKSSKKADPSAIMACCVLEGKLYVLEVVQVWLSFTRLIPFIKKFTSETGATSKSRFWIEPKASGISIADYLKNQSGIDLIVIKGEASNDSKETKLKAVSPKIEAGKLILVNPDNDLEKQTPWITKYISELTSVNPIFDDQRDVTTFAIKDLLLKKSANYGKYSYI